MRILKDTTGFEGSIHCFSGEVVTLSGIGSNYGVNKTVSIFDVDLNSAMGLSSVIIND